MSRHRRKPAHQNSSDEDKYAVLPPRIDLSQTVASHPVSVPQVEQSDQPDWNLGADPYLRITGWKRP